jgi:epsilon-lactone hydrolase
MVFWLLLIAVFITAVSLFYLRGEDLSRFDAPITDAVVRKVGGTESMQTVAALLQDLSQRTVGLSWRARIDTLRHILDDIGEAHELSAHRIPVHNELVSGEWIVPADADTTRRFLYVHGGAWIAGSPVSHRGIVERMALAASAAVFALDYRLLPEHSRMDGIIDCRAAYEWLIVNGPTGPEPLTFFAIGGDSAGGNLALATLIWARDEGLRLPNRVVALSPATDAVMASPSLRSNALTDLMLGPQFGPVNRWPRPVLWWATWLLFRIAPSDPRISPLRADLSGLPPILIQASADEMLLDDARRFVNKACASGSPATLQLWAGMVHVWHMFADTLPQADEAFVEIAAFLADADAPEPEVAEVEL